MNKRITTEIIINTTREKLWEVLTNFPAYPEWNPFIVSIEGRLEKNSRLKVVLQNGTKQMVFKPKLLHVHPQESFEWLGNLFVKGLFDGKHSFRIEDAGEGQLKLIHTEEFSGLLSSFILKKIGTETRNNFIKMNQALKRKLELLEP